MISKAIEKSERAIDACKNHLRQMQEATQTKYDDKGNLSSQFYDGKALREAWSCFLVAANRFFSSLEQGAKSSNKSSNWYQRIKQMRKEDALLRYAHHARHSDEHRILEEVTEQTNLKLKAEGGAVTVTSTKDTDRFFIPKGTKATFSLPYLVVTKVVNRGVEYDTPATHNGKPISDLAPENLASLILATLTSILEEAKRLERA